MLTFLKCCFKIDALQPEWYPDCFSYNIWVVRFRIRIGGCFVKPADELLQLFLVSERWSQCSVILWTCFHARGPFICHCTKFYSWLVRPSIKSGANYLNPSYVVLKLSPCTKIWCRFNIALFNIPSDIPLHLLPTTEQTLSTYSCKYLKWQTWGSRQDWCMSPPRMSWWPCPPLSSSGRRCSGWRRCSCADTTFRKHSL